MKTRIFKTKFWSDGLVRRLSSEAKFLFIYLLTNQYVSLTSYYELDDGQILLDLGFDQKKLLKAKDELSKNKRAFFYKGWIFIPNLDKHNPYWKSPKTEEVYKKELESIPKEVLDYFDKIIDSSMDSTMDGTMDSTIHSTPKTKNINNNTKNINNNTENINNNKIINLSSPSNLKDDKELHKSKNYLKKIIEDKEFCYQERKEHFSQKNSINATIVEIQREAEKSLNWLEANGKVKKNYRAFLHNWLIKSFGYKFRQ